VFPGSDGTASIKWSKKRSRCSKQEEDDSDNMLSLVISRLRDTKQEDKFDVIGKNIVSKLRSLPNDLRIYAEKLTNDVLFEAELSNLTTKRLDITDHQYPQQG
jgi:hypothetical protein